ncbi:MAG: hypothetical protein HWE25_08240 [Alphaproteobacteria bacterium]|nr:hypothetical protein [Alphaproteobacteria bacterium]
MAPQSKAFMSLLNERTVAVAIIFAVALLWSVGQITFLSGVIIAAVTGVTLLQLSLKRRFEELEARRKAIQKRKKDNRTTTVSIRAKALDLLPSPFLLIDSNHQIAVANVAARELLGSEIVGNDVSLYLRQSNFVAALEATLSDPDADLQVIRYTTSKDRSFDVTVAAVPQMKSDRNGPEAMLFFYEVTSLIRAEQMRADFVANASHELRTPLTSILGFIETLIGPAADDIEAHGRFLGIMQTEAERMVRLIDDLLSLSRIEMTRYVAPDMEVDLSKLIVNTVSTLQPRASDRGITLKSDIPSGLPLVRADGDQLTQVFINLLSNAAKYCDQDSSVHVTAAPALQEGWIHLTIRDEGPGISEEHLGRLTERFYRVDTARSRKMGGTGLGLAIVKHILLRHDSALEIKSELGKGTTFAFKLPVAKINNA